MTNEEICKAIEEGKIIAIARGVAPEKAVKLAEALYAGGIRFMEFTFNMRDVDSTAADEAISAVTKAMGDRMFVGCGTCSYTELVDRAHKAGARFVISADTNIDVIKRTKELGMISIPGVATATEAMTAAAAGADYVKVFPAANLGADYIKALRSPLSHLKYMAVGGIDDKNIADFIKNGCVGAGVGGSLVKSDWVENDEYDKITELAKHYVQVVSGK